MRKRCEKIEIIAGMAWQEWPQKKRINSYNGIMPSPLKRWSWRILKVGLPLLVLSFVGWQFQKDLSRLDLARVPWRPSWLFLSAVLYLAALLPSAWYWHHLHELFGYPMPFYAALRAHYIGQLGKYVPGKAMALLVRSALVHPLGVPLGVSTIVSFYEVFTGMAAGAFIAAVLYLIRPPQVLGDEPFQFLGIEWQPMWIGVLLIGICGIPLVPGVFNFVIGRMAARFQAIELYRLPPVRFGTLCTGLLATGAGWGLQGLSWWAMLQAVLPEQPGFSLSMWAQCTASSSFANVAGFVIMVPGGLGVREYLLMNLLSFAAPSEYIAWAAVLLRLDWILAEVFLSLVVFCWKPKPGLPVP